MDHADHLVPGDATGKPIPATAEALAAGGPALLTALFRAYGSIGPDNTVTAITRCESFAGGNSGHKMLLSVAYARAEPGLDTDLFVKLSRDFADPFRDRRRYELEAEVRLADLSRLPAFPVAVARPCFADFHHDSGTGILITARIPFGKGAIEPLRPKCMDHLLPNALEHYQATVGALARLAAAHRAGALSPDVERLFPYDRAAAEADLPIAFDAAGLRRRIAAYADFAAACPRLLPPHLRDPDFVAKWEADALAFLTHEQAVRRFLQADADFVALAHWNTNLDNAWFWRDAAGMLQCGLLDWGMVRQMNVGLSLWGGLSAAGMAMLDAHLDSLLAQYAQARGLDAGQLALHFDLSVALVGLSMMTDVAALITGRVPSAAEASGPHDPIIRADPVAHGFLTVFANFLNLWATRDFGASLTRIL